MILTVTNLKGGVGKTSIAALVISALAEKFGADQIACGDLDADQLALSMMLSRHSDLIIPIYTELDKIRQTSDNGRIVIVDTAPVLAGLLPLYECSDRIILPTRLSVIDIQSLQRTIQVLPKGVPMRIVGNCWADSMMSRQAVEFITETYQTMPALLPPLKMLERNLVENGAALTRGMSGKQIAAINAVLSYILGGK